MVEKTIEKAFADFPIDRVHSSRVHAHQDFAFGRLWSGDFFDHQDFRSAVFVDAYRFHSRSRQCFHAAWPTSTPRCSDRGI